MDERGNPYEGQSFRLTEKQTFIIIEDPLGVFLDQTNEGYALRCEGDEGRMVFIFPNDDLQFMMGQVYDVLKKEFNE